MKNQKLHYYLISGIVMFTIKDGESIEPNTIPCNAIVRHTTKLFPAHKLAHAQQNLQKGMMLKIPDTMHAGIQIRDVIVQSVSYLGVMTEEEFQAPPPGMELVTAPEVS
jgi:hypothetical protein